MVTCSKDQFPTQLPESKAYQWNPPPKKKNHKKTIFSFSNAIKHLRKPCNMREKQTFKNSYFISPSFIEIIDMKKFHTKNE